MRSENGPPVRLLCTEPLEGRWLLSAASGAAAAPAAPPSDPVFEVRDDDADDADDAEEGSPPGTSAPAANVLADDDGQRADLNDPEDDFLETPAVPETSGAFSDTELADAPQAPESIEVIELEPADEDEADGDVDVRPAELPAAVRAAFEANYPGAKVIEAEYGFDDGEGEYDITAKFHGDVVDVTFTPGGEIIETERALTSDELPHEVLDWVREHFADATIGEASVMVEDGVQQYEVLIATADGTQTEATLRVPGLDTPGSEPGGGGDDGEETPDEPPVNTVPPETEVAGRSGEHSVAATEPAGEPDAAAGAEPSATAAASATSNPSETAAAQIPAAVGPNANKGIAANAADALAAAARAARVAAALQALAAGEPADRWLPQLAGVLGDVFTADTAGAESRVDAILARIDALAEEVGAGGVREAGGPSRLAMVAALIAASQLYRLHPRRARAGQAVVFNAAAAAGTNSWSWVLGKPSDDSRERPL